MRIIHSIRDLKKEGEGEGSFLLADRKGGYLCLPNKPENESNYQGWLSFHSEDWTLYKTIENIWIPDKDVNTVHNKYSHVERDSGAITERFFITDDALLYEVNNYEGFVSIDMDFRQIYDYDDEGRVYEINTREGGLLIIKYIKYTDGSLSEIEHERYMAVKNVKDYWTSGEWVERNYDYDQERNSRSDFYIYGTLNIRVSRDDKLVFAHAATEKEAVEKANNAWHRGHDWKEDNKKITDKELFEEDIILNTAMNALNSLIVEPEETEGIFAGYPWFHQFWRRDELISAGALVQMDEHPLLKELLMGYLHRIREDGWLDNKNVDSDLESADATGWLFVRFHDFLKSLKQQGELFDHFTKEELYKVKEKVEEAIHAVIENHSDNGLVVNGRLETWMDTFADHDFREGARIEIQALHLRMHQFAGWICKVLGEEHEQHEKAEEEFRKKVVKNFYKDGKLADGVLDGEQDMTQRSNIFIAHYVYPELLSNEKWKKAFDNALKELWLEWGGLASISKNHELFTNTYTGETNQSYHRGDSWYWVNNLAAICMRKVDEKKYKDKVNKIKEASVNEMLFSGYMGHCSEVSSAKQRESKGAKAQAWSAATLIELLQ